MKTIPLLVPAMLLLAACTPTATDTASVATASLAATNTASPSALPPSTSPSQTPSTTTRAEPASRPSSDMPATESNNTRSSNTSIRGAIRNGNRPPPALRVCATPVDGGTATCIETAEGASEYRIDVGPGHYYLLGWAQSGELTLIAHASQIRCIRAPCPPDELIDITVAAGEQRDGIDLNGAYVDIPDGWPKRPA